MEKGDDVGDDDDDDDAVRTSVSQVQVTEKLCSKELFLRTCTWFLHMTPDIKKCFSIPFTFNRSLKF
jgi:hypothetical protein